MSARAGQTFKFLLSVVIIAVFGYGLVWRWIICRVYVAPGYLMYITAKTGKENPNSDAFRVVKPGTKGVQEDFYGEGRHFINPVLCDRVITPINTPLTSKGRRIPRNLLPGYIAPLEVGVVKSLSGANLATGDFLVPSGEDKKGMLENPLTPGIWRLNPKAYQIDIEKAIVIDPGYVGCVISLSGKKPKKQLAQDGERGVMEKVLQPGIYFINSSAYKVLKVEISYREIYFRQLNFKSKDGFEIEVDATVIWGVLPEKIPYIIDRVGSISDVADKIIQPQVDSLCRIEGSKYGAVELVEGISREKFQKNFTEQLNKICDAKEIKIFLGLIRSINIPQIIRDPIQKSKIALEEMKTKKERQETQKVLNQLERLKQEVVKGVQEVLANTERSVATTLAEGAKKVAEIQAQKEVEVAQLQKDIAEIEAQTTRLIGEARAKAQELKRRAEADRLVQNIHAIGGAEAYSLYTFAQKLSNKLQIVIRHTGQGTLWTDLPAQLKDIEKIAALKILENQDKQDNQDRKK